MRKVRGFTLIELLMVILLVFLLISCAALKDQWNKLTPQEQNRLVLNGIQKEFNDLFAQARDYVNANPKYEKDWVSKALPAFSLANKTLKQVILESMDKSTSLSDLLKRITPLIADIKLLLKGIGFDPSKFLTNL